MDLHSLQSQAFSLSAKALSHGDNKKKLVTVTKAKQFLSAWDATEYKQLISNCDLYVIYCRDMELPIYRLTCMISKSSYRAIRKSRPPSDNVLSEAFFTQSRLKFISLKTPSVLFGLFPLEKFALFCSFSGFRCHTNKNKKCIIHLGFSRQLFSLSRFMVCSLAIWPVYIYLFICFCSTGNPKINRNT